MFDVFCHHCHKRQLLTAGRVRGINNTKRGIAVSYQCWCGESSIWLTGRRFAGSGDREPATLAG